MTRVPIVFYTEIMLCWISKDAYFCMIQRHFFHSLPLKGIVSWDWDWLEWIVNERSKELRIAGAYFYCFLMPFSCFNLQKASFVGFSFDSYSADDEQQPQIGLIHRFCTCTINSLRGNLLPRWRNRSWRYLQDDCHHFVESFAIGTVLSACFFYWQVIIDHRCRSAVVTHHSQSNCLMRNRCGLIFQK